MMIYGDGDRVISFIYSPSGLDTIQITSDGKTLEDIMVNGTEGYYTKDDVNKKIMFLPFQGN